jgi:enoyl-CoA hydratase
MESLNFGHVYAESADGVASIVIARPEKRNAQSPTLLYQLDEAMTWAARCADVKVVLVRAEGPDFSAGHDLRAAHIVPGEPVASLEGTYARESRTETHLAFECDAYLGLCRRWRDLPKPTIAAVRGRVIGGGLMLVWPMDLVVASESTQFSDPVTAFGVNGAEYFAHVWELGARRAKEMLFTGDALDARDALALGMVNRVVPDALLEEEALRLAQRIARRSPFALRLAKASVNQSLLIQGLDQAIDSAFGLHTLGHANNLERYGQITDPRGSDLIRADRGTTMRQAEDSR